MFCALKSRSLAVAIIGGIGLAAMAGAGSARADALTTAAAAYKPFVVENIGKAVKGATDMQAAVRAGDAKAAQKAWIASRRGWERIETIAGEFFGDLDEAIDSWPDPEHGYHAIEAALFAGKLDGLAPKVDELVKNLAAFHEKVSAPSFAFAPQGLMNGMAGLAYEIGENKAKGGESPYAGTSLIDMQENVEGIEALYGLVFAEALKAKDAKLAHDIHEQIEKVEDLVKVSDIKKLNQAALTKAGESLAVQLQLSAPKLGLEKPKLTD
jgi:iron uptake system EfeUOB component EfeO/EfeM